MGLCIMINSKNVSDFQNKMERLDILIAAYDENLGTANDKAVADGLLEGVVQSAPGVNAANYDHFTMFIDRWGTSTRKVGR
jgi:hypothetical protein